MRALVGALVLAVGMAAAPAAAADTGDLLSYYGGPVAHSMNGIVVDWGSGVNQIYTDGKNGDPGLIQSLATSSGSPASIGGVLAQYMDNTGANAAPQVTYGGQYPIMPSVNPATIFDWQIQRELVSQIDAGVTAGGLPRPAGNGLATMYLVLFPAGHTECLDRSTCSGQAFCAYHGNAQLSDGTPVLYAVLPDNTTASPAMNQGCGSAPSPLANQTSYTSHEWSEAITDPLVAQANPGPAAAPLAWYDDNCPTASSSCGEVGDKCNAEQAQAGAWTVQLEWSNLDKICESTEPTYSTPTASFTAGAGAVAAQAVSFDASSSSDPPSNHTSINGIGSAIQPGIAGYSWNWGDGSPVDGGATPTHAFAGPGVYQVSLTVTDHLGFISTVTKPVEISSASPSAPIATTGGATGVGTQSATVAGTIDTGGQPVSYSFAYGTSPAALHQSTPATHLGPGTSPVAVSTVLSGLTPASTYYYRLDVVAAGQTYSGAVQSFITATGAGAQTSGSGSSGSGSGSPGSTPTPSPRPAPAPQLPSAATGGVSRVSSSGATVTGSVDPDGAQTSYHVEFGTSKAYGHSSLPASAGAGTSSLAVRATLTGLRPRSLYHYRLVATSTAGTAVGVDRTFKTRAAPPPAPRFSFAGPARMTMSQALAGQLRVRFHCGAACTARFTVTIALPGIKRVQAIPVTFARGTGRVGRAGYGQARLTFTSAARRALRHARLVKLVISGYAVRGGSAPSAPRAARLTLTR